MDPEEDRCPLCGEGLVWGAGPACPNDCDLEAWDAKVQAHAARPANQCRLITEGPGERLFSCTRRDGHDGECNRGRHA